MGSAKKPLYNFSLKINFISILFVLFKIYFGPWNLNAHTVTARGKGLCLCGIIEILAGGGFIPHFFDGFLCLLSVLFDMCFDAFFKQPLTVCQCSCAHMEATVIQRGIFHNAIV